VRISSIPVHAGTAEPLRVTPPEAVAYHAGVSLLAAGTCYEETRYDQWNPKQEARERQRAIKALEHLGYTVTVERGVIALFPTMCSVRQWESTSHNVSLASGQHKWGWQEGTYLVK
jgi:hypothetical protein